VTKTETPPPGAVFELCEQLVDFVCRALGIALDYTAETLPVLDHYLKSVPEDEPAAVALVATTAGAYFGEVARRTLGGAWETGDAPPESWQVRLTGDVTFAPVGFAAGAIHEAPGPRAQRGVGCDVDEDAGRFDVPPDRRAAVEEALDARGAVPEDEYYSLSGRLETLMLVVDVVMAAAAPAPPTRS